MIRLERYGDVTRLRMSTWRSRSIGYEVSAYFAHGTLVDSGFPDVGAELESLVRELRPIGAIITHAHEDHAGNVIPLARLGVPLALSNAALASLRAAPRIRLYRRYTWGQPRSFTEPFTPYDPSHLQVIPAPGHCPDHRVVWDAEHGTLFSADLWLGIHAKLMHHEEDPRQLVRDLRAAAALAPERMFDAHRGPVRDPARALAAKADWLDEMIGVIERRAREGWTDRTIVRAVLGGEEWAGFVSRGEYARANLVRNVRAGMEPAAPSPPPSLPA
ncbi:MAG TPA: MBL fold metallo-hydrolase [Gemmatimonadaceae bacterium]|nr:MBL fold metallo-hydrolase [Gemmatimonadaceae bacterium]